MIIGIDGKPLSLKFECGLKTYTRKLIEHLASIDSTNDYVIFSKTPVNIPKKKNFKNISPTGYLTLLPWQIIFPSLLKTHSVDVLHIPQQHGSIFINHSKLIVTVHDLAKQDSYPQLLTSPFYYFLGKYTRYIRNRLIQKAKYIITDTHFIKEEFERFMPNKPVSTVYLGRPNGINQARKPIRNIILSMTDFSPRKNIMRSLIAYSLLEKEHKEKHPFHIIVSMKNPLSELKKMIIKLGLTDYIKIHVAVSDKKLALMYSSAAVFLYPSLYEGFGLPVLEAMTYNTPVITSRNSATEEIAGNAAFLVNPYSVHEISNALFMMLSSKKLLSSLSRNAQSQIKKYSWVKMAHETLNVYEKIFRSENRPRS